MAVVCLEGAGLQMLCPPRTHPILRMLGALGFVQQKPGKVLLEDIDLTLEEGVFMAAVGEEQQVQQLLLLAAGLRLPNRGQCRIRGQVGAAIWGHEGLLPRWSGEKNVLNRCRLQGLSPGAARMMAGFVGDFAQLGEKWRRPVAEYAPEERARLAMSLAVGGWPDLIVEQGVLSRCSLQFQDACVRRMKKLRTMGTSVLMGDSPAASRLCQQALWMEEGALRRVGDYHSVLRAYRRPRRSGDAAAFELPLKAADLEAAAPIAPSLGDLERRQKELGLLLAKSLLLMRDMLLQKKGPEE